MAICPDCDRELLTATSCTVSMLHLGPTVFVLAPYRPGGSDTPSAPGGGRCGDCGVEQGGHHHLGCGQQRCPRCAGQLIGCRCPFDELGDGADEVSADEDDRDVGVGVADDEAHRRDPDRFSHRACPRCGSESIVAIFYGRPTAAMRLLASRRAIELAEAPFDPGKPGSRCRDCDHTWISRAG